MCQTCWENLRGNINIGSQKPNLCSLFSFLTVNLHSSLLFNEKCHTMHQRNHLENNLHQLWTLLAWEHDFSFSNCASAPCELSFVLTLTRIIYNQFDFHMWAQQSPAIQKHQQDTTWARICPSEDLKVRLNLLLLYQWGASTVFQKDSKECFLIFHLRC